MVEVVHKRGWKPTRSELVDLRKTHTVKQIADFYKVSKSTVEPWLTSYGIKYHECHYDKINVSSFNSLQTDILTGTMLGDASIPFCKVGNSSFQFTQSKTKTDYVEYIRESLRPFSRKLEFLKRQKPIREDGRVKHNVSKQIIECCRIRTAAHGLFSDLRNVWYPDGSKGAKKYVPKTLKLNWRMMAFWFCDDGSNHTKFRSLNIYTDGFVESDVDFLIKRIKKDLHINASKNKHLDNWIIRIGNESYVDFLSNISGYIPWECLAYKLAEFHLKRIDVSKT